MKKANAKGMVIALVALSAAIALDSSDDRQQDLNRFCRYAHRSGLDRSIYCLRSMPSPVIYLKTWLENA